MVYCQAHGCQNASGKGLEKTFHPIPNKDKNPGLFKKWAIAVKVEKFLNVDYKWSRHDVICSDHFVENDWECDMRAKLTGAKERKKLKESAIPSVFKHRSSLPSRESSLTCISSLDSKRYLQSVVRSFTKPSTSQSISRDEPPKLACSSKAESSTSAASNKVNLGDRTDSHPEKAVSPDEPEPSSPLPVSDEPQQVPKGRKRKYRKRKRTRAVKANLPEKKEKDPESQCFQHDLQPSSPFSQSDDQIQSRPPSAKRRKRHHKKLKKFSPLKSSPVKRVLPLVCTSSCMTADVSTQTTSSIGMESKSSQCPDDFSHIKKDHTYCCEQPVLLKPTFVYLPEPRQSDDPILLPRSPPPEPITSPDMSMSPPHCDILPESEESTSAVPAVPPSSVVLPDPISVTVPELAVNSVSDSVSSATRNDVNEQNDASPPGSDSHSETSKEADLEDYQSSSSSTSSSPATQDSSYHSSDESFSSSDETDEEPDEFRFCMDRKFIVFESQLDQLLYRTKCTNCMGGHVSEIVKSFVGTMLAVKAVCVCGSTISWHSQPMLGKQPAGNLLASASLLFSGSTYEDISFFSRLLNLKFISHTTHADIQRSILFPTINTFFESSLRTEQDAVKGDPITICGDGRCDSPGYNAKYCTYTMINMPTHKIIAMALVQVSETTSSVAMEKVGFRRTLNDLLDSGIQVEVAATDRHVGIRKALKEEYPTIQHQFDVWHLSKSITKKLAKKAKQRDCKELGPWIKAISNHIWWSCQNCGEDEIMLVEMIQSLTHHVCNIHSWTSGEKFHECAHAPLTQEHCKRTKWITPGSKSHKAIQDVLFDKRLVKDLKQLTKACHTSAIEAYHSLYLKYCPKRLHFRYPGMLARSQLAVLDHNANTKRPQAIVKKEKEGSGKKGDRRFKFSYSKAAKTWIASQIPEEKDYSYLWDLMVAVLKVKSGTFEVMNPVLPELPKNVAPTERPSREEMIAKVTTRIKNT